MTTLSAILLIPVVCDYNISDTILQWRGAGPALLLANGKN